MDASPTCDGAAAVIITSDPALARQSGMLLQITASAASTGLS
jgi:hypothetical protein